MKVSTDDKNSSRLMVVNPTTGMQFDEHVIEVSVDDCWITCFDTMKVYDVDTETEVEVIAREKDYRHEGPGVRWRVKMYRRYCDFDVVERETGLVIAEARYINVTTRI